MPVWAQVLATAAALATLYAGGKAVWRAGAALIRGARRASQFMDDWFGEAPRPGLPDGRPGLLARIDSIEQRIESLPTRAEVAEMRERLDAVEAQLRPNGGTSLRDAVDRISERPRVESGGLGFSAELAPEL